MTVATLQDIWRADGHFSSFPKVARRSRVGPIVELRLGVGRVVANAMRLGQLEAVGLVVAVAHGRHAMTRTQLGKVRMPRRNPTRVVQVGQTIIFIVLVCVLRYHDARPHKARLVMANIARTGSIVVERGDQTQFACYSTKKIKSKKNYYWIFKKT